MVHSGGVTAFSQPVETFSLVEVPGGPGGGVGLDGYSLVRTDGRGFRYNSPTYNYRYNWVRSPGHNTTHLEAIPGIRDHSTQM